MLSTERVVCCRIPIGELGFAAMAGAKQGMSLLKYIPKALRPSTADISSGVLWGGTAVVGAIWLVQPFGWMKEQIWPTPEAEQK